MRSFAALIEKARIREVAIPDKRLDRARSAFDRVEEGIRQVFDEACVNGELGAASDLLNLMETWHAGRADLDADQKRVSATRLQRMRGELERRRIVRGFRPVRG